ncbi:hypothetical protein FRB90_010718 [Tulasnella sp. 427]|nr:hypothetical protein FRB90_010718 [Tulasnella sp. 427]
MQLSISLLALLAAVASSTAVPRASSKCHSIDKKHKGYLVTNPGGSCGIVQPRRAHQSPDASTAVNHEKFVAVGLNKKKQVTYGAGDPHFTVEFQACPKLADQEGSIDWWKGRIVVSGTNNCVTVTNPNGPEGGPFFLAVKKCEDDVNPPASQQWEWGNDFGAVVFWRGKSEAEEIGYTIDSNYNPVTEKASHLLNMQISVALLALFAAAASSTAVPRASDKCYTVPSHKGYLSTYPGEHPKKWVAVGLNKKNQVTYGAGDPHFLVEFQACPKVPGGQYPKLNDYNGRIIVSGTNKCLTVTNPNGAEGGPFFLVVEKCGSDVNVPASQAWEFGNDFGAVVFWKGKSEMDEVGYTDDNKLNPVTEKGTHRIDLGCAKTCSSFGIKTKKDLQ